MELINRLFATKKLINKLKYNEESLKKFLKKKSISDFDMKKAERAKTTFEFDNEFTLKVLAKGLTHQEYYKELSCLDYLDSIKNPILFIQSKNDPVCR
jgi:predicted alpha/beta-fold hydrolase